MILPGITVLAKELATFMHYRDGSLWYQIIWWESAGKSKVFQFPIPVADSGEGTFDPVMKGVQLLRWIRKYLEFVKSAQGLLAQ